jgi:excisionase family DNA binding protein
MAPLSYTIRTASEATGLSAKTIDRAIKSGKLRSKRSGETKDGEPTGSYVILADELQTWLENLRDA